MKAENNRSNKELAIVKQEFKELKSVRRRKMESKANKQVGN